jgi:hypothetical protein
MGRNDKPATPNRTKKTRHRTNQTNPLTNVGRLMKNLIAIPLAIALYYILKKYVHWQDTKTPPIKYPNQKTD